MYSLDKKLAMKLPKNHYYANKLHSLTKCRKWQLGIKPSTQKTLEFCHQYVILKSQNGA
jgi:hypothetical protein